MSYKAPYIDKTGYHYPSYQDILDDIITRFQEIYGDGIYLGSDSQDYEIISIFAMKIYHAFQAVELAYNAHSPVTAIGTALDYVVALNGINRIQGTNSVATLTLTGTAGTVINKGIVSDIEGRLWDLPETVTLDGNGSASVDATCRETGVVTAEAGAISRIMTPTLGWVSVTNTGAATAGTYTESDASLRARQVNSVAMPSQSILSGLKGALQAINGIESVDVYENDTNTTDINTGITAHSICAVLDYDPSNTDLPDIIARTILNYKSCGCSTYNVSDSGEYKVSREITDAATGQPYTVKYQRIESVDIGVTVAITRAAGYSTAYVEKITTALVEYLNSLGAGQTVSIAMLSAVVMNCNENLANPDFVVTSVSAAKGTETREASDVVFDADEFYKRAHGRSDYITINVT